jgi:hypothetical protein
LVSIFFIVIFFEIIYKIKFFFLQFYHPLIVIYLSYLVPIFFY